jgi:hypothetical protein
MIRGNAGNVAGEAADDSEALNAAVVEVKRMLTGLLRPLMADA